MPVESPYLSLPVEIWLDIYQHFFDAKDRAKYLLPIVHTCHQFRIKALPVYFGNVPFDVKNGFILEDVRNVSGINTGGLEGVDYSFFRFDNGVFGAVHNMTSLMIRARRPLIKTRCSLPTIAEARAEVPAARKEQWAIHSVQEWLPSRFRFWGTEWSPAMRSNWKRNLIGEASISVRSWKKILEQINLAKLS